MGLYNLPSDTKELEEKLNAIMPDLIGNLNVEEKVADQKADNVFVSLNDRLSKMQKAYLTILSGEQNQLDDDACSNLAELEMIFSPNNDVDKIKAKYSNMPISDVIRQMNVFWQTIMLQGDINKMQENYAILSKNDIAAQKLKFKLWKQELDQNLASDKQYKNIAEAINFFGKILFERDDAELSKEEGTEFTDKIKDIEKAFGFDDNFARQEATEATKSLENLRKYCRLRMQNLTEYAAKQTPVLPYDLVISAIVIPEDLPDIDSKLLAWKQRQAEQPQENKKEDKADNKAVAVEQEEEVKQAAEAEKKKEVKQAVEPAKKEEPKQEVEPAKKEEPQQEAAPEKAEESKQEKTSMFPLLEPKGKNSKLMQKVMESVTQCEMLMDSTINAEKETEAVTKVLDKIDQMLITAVKDCRKYRKNCKIKSEDDRTQLHNVGVTMAILKEQYRQISILRKHIEEPGMRNSSFPTGSQTIKDFLEYVNRVDMAQQAAEIRQKSAVSQLTYADFMSMLSPWDNDYVEFYKGELRIATNVANSAGKNNVATEDNKAMLEKLAKLAVKQEVRSRQNRKITSSQNFKSMRYEVYRKMLGVSGATEAGAISMPNLRKFIEELNLRCSMVNTIKKNSSNFTKNELELAESVDSQTKVRRYSTYKANQAAEAQRIKTILRNGIENGINIELTNKQIDALSSGGHLSSISDIAYSLINGTFNCARNIKSGKGVYVHAYKNDKFVAQVLAYATKIEAATTAKERQKLRDEAGAFCAEYAFEQMGKKDLLDDINKYRISELSAGAKGLREYAVSIFSTVKEWRGKEAQVAVGIAKLEKLCYLMSQHREMVEKIVGQGIGNGDIDRLTSLGTSIQTIITDKESMELMSLVSRNIPKTRLKSGMEKLQALIEKGDFNYTSFTEKINLAVKDKKDVNNLDKDIDEKKSVPKADTDEAKLSRLNQEARKVAQLFMLKTAPSDLIVSNQGDVNQIKYLHERLGELKRNNAATAIVNIGSTTAELSCNKDGTIDIIVDGEEFETHVLPSKLIRRIEEDMCEHADIYKLDNIKPIISDNLKNYSFEMLSNLLKHTANIDRKLLYDATNGELANIVLQSLETNKSAEELLAILESGPENHPNTMIDTQATDAINELDQTTKKCDINSIIQFSNEYDKAPKAEGKVTWTAEEKAIKDFISELIWPSEEWKLDITDRISASDRTRYTVYNHAEALALIAQDSGKIKAILDKLKLNDIGLQDLKIQEMFLDEKTGIANKLSINNVLGGHMPITGAALGKCDTQELGNIIKGLVGNEADIEQAAEALRKFICKKDTDVNTLISELAADHMDIVMNIARDQSGKKPGDLTDEERKSIINTAQFNLNAAKNFDGEADFDQEYYDMVLSLRSGLKINEKLVAVDNYVASLVNRTIVPALQKQINTTLDKQTDNTETNIFIDAGVADVSDLLNDSSISDNGQGQFQKNIMNGYFISAGIAEQRGMIASALREIEPSQLNDKITNANEITKLKEQQKGSLLSGLFKGAGPLMHKTLQGVPTTGLPLSLQIALDATKSHLNHIPKEFVMAQMNRMIEESQGTITNVEVVKSLGAASVGEAFLCKIHGAGVQKEGREIVIKLLRPDVRKRMEKEKEFFIKSANNTNAGMGKTFASQMEIYEQELDLCIEANNIQQGRVYNNGKKTVQSEEMVGLIQPSVNMIALEKANGVTVGDYYRELQHKRDSYVNNQSKDTDSSKNAAELTKLTGDLVKKQGFLTTLAEKWVTEAIYNKGFYQADLHKDNIIVDNDKATIIDYGNATLLTDEQKLEIMHMVTCAGLGMADDFVDHYVTLLSEESRNSLNKTREQAFRGAVKDIFGRKGEVGSKIALVLMEAQKMGFELPKAVYNFSQGQLRLQNTINDGNDILKELGVQLEQAVTKHWEQRYNALDKFRQYYINNPNIDTEEYRDFVMKELGLLHGGPDSKDDESVLDFLNDLIKDDNGLNEIRRLSTFLPDISTKDQQKDIFTLVIEKAESPKFAFTQLKVVGNEKQQFNPDDALAGEFRQALVSALMKECETYIEAQKFIQAARNPKDFLSVMSNVINANQEKTLDLFGVVQSYKYKKHMDSYKKFAKQAAARENTITSDDIAHLQSLCQAIVNISGQLEYPKKRKEQQLNREDIVAISPEIGQIAMELRRLPDSVLPLQAKRYIVENLGYYNAKQAVAGFKRHMSGEKLKGTKEEIAATKWLTDKSTEEFYNDPLNSKRMYNLRNALRLTRGYLERMQKTQAGLKLPENEQTQIRAALENSSAAIEKIKWWIGDEEFERLRLYDFVILDRELESKTNESIHDSNELELEERDVPSNDNINNNNQTIEKIDDTTTANEKENKEVIAKSNIEEQQNNKVDAADNINENKADNNTEKQQIEVTDPTIMIVELYNRLDKISKDDTIKTVVEPGSMDRPVDNLIEIITMLDTFEQKQEPKLKVSTGAEEYYAGYRDYIYTDQQFDRRKYKDINSNDINVLQQLKRNAKNDASLNSYLQHRINCLKKINNLMQNADMAVPVGQPEINEKGDVVLKGVSQKASQSTGNGCWSVALATLLSYRGIDIDQNVIRAFRPDIAGFNEDDLLVANSDSMNSLSNYTDMIQELLPATMVNKLDCDRELSDNEAKGLLKDCIKMALAQHNSPMALLYGGHYRTVYGLEGDTVLYYDTMIKKMQTKSLDDMIKSMGYTCVADSRTCTKYKFVAEWFQDMELDLNREPVLNDTLAKEGASYLGDKLTNNKSVHVNATRFKGYQAGEIRNVPIVSMLPSEIKLKDNKMVGSFNISIFEDIAKKAQQEGASNEVVDLLHGYPKENMTQILLNTDIKKWAKRLQEQLKKDVQLVSITEKERENIRLALEAIRHTLIMQEKQELKDMINKNFRIKNDRITYLSDETSLARTKVLFEKAANLKNIEQMNLEQDNWMDRLGKKVIEDSAKEQLKQNGIMDLLDQAESFSKGIVEQFYSISGSGGDDADKSCSMEIPSVYLMTEIEAGRFPDKAGLAKRVESAKESLSNMKKISEGDAQKLLDSQKIDTSKFSNTNSEMASSKKTAERTQKKKLALQ